MSYVYSNKRSLIDKRRKLRKNQTTAEHVLWQRLRRGQLGVKFRRQCSIGSFIVDFYCHELKLIIELDGWIHGEEEHREKDIVRQQMLETQGYKIRRYKNEQIRYELKSVLQDIWNVVCDLKDH
ncbi:MAG: endonuclease domain-containing protein [Candidatus Magasanikbacteria bacterium]|nr:endonuclease domain-containing protein [Candidatus Magasanikbacteria bacterium]